MRLRISKRQQAGDTIVEVLIAIAIISVILVGAFVVSNRSTQAVQDSQEHDEMFLLLQGQIELLRQKAVASSDETTGIYESSPKYFCMDGSGNVAPFTASVSVLPPIASDDFSQYAAACKNINNRYNVAIDYDSTTKTFTATGRWYSTTGFKGQEQLVYRVHAGAASIVPTIPSPGGGGDAGLAPAPTSPGGLCRGLATDPYPDCWQITLVNGSSNSQSILDHCEVTWGDGANTTYTGAQVAAHCLNGETLGPHDYPHEGTVADPDYYTASITNYFNNGYPPVTYVFPHRLGIPY